MPREGVGFYLRENEGTLANSHVSKIMGDPYWDFITDRSSSSIMFYWPLAATTALLVSTKNIGRSWG